MARGSLRTRAGLRQRALGDGSGRSDGLACRDGVGEVLSERRNLLGIGEERFTDTFGHFVPGAAERDDPGQIREVGPPSAVVGSFENDYVLAHRRCSSPLALRMLESVPTE